MIPSSREGQRALAVADGDRDAAKEPYDEYSEDPFRVAYRLPDSPADARRAPTPVRNR